ncbi:MAG: TonB-dependent receptor [Acidobacteria bacterium]|nr:TonB-dependent receptor [Acidobacteriota bacterium]
MSKWLTFACVLLASASAAAQSSITGTVTDDAGRVLPGVNVEATSGGVVEGRRAVVTDGAGRYAITDLRPGEYALEFTLPGFDPARRDGLVLGAGTTLPVDATLSVAPPGVDPRRARRGLVMTRDMQEAIPTGRSLWSYALLIPGVKVHKPDVGGTAGVQQSEMLGRGLDAAHNTVEIDGMTVNTMISDGRYQAYLNPMLATETSYTMSGHGAETQTGGLRINMIPNEGGDRFGGSVFIGGSPREADNLNPRLEALGVSRPARVKLYDVNGSFGGPVLRDRLRFFTSARQNAADFGVGYRGALEGEAGENNLAGANARLTWQVTPQHKLSVMFDKARKRRFGQHGPGVDLGTAASAWTSPHYDTGTAKWTGAPSGRMLAEFGFSLSYQDWDTNYYQYRQDGPSIFQARPDAADLAACFETPCFPPVGSARHAAQLAPALGGDPWYSQVSTYDGLLGLLYGAKADGENNNYTRRWSYRGALSHVTGSHSVKLGMDFSRGRNRHTNTSNGHLELRYEDAPNPRGRLIQDQHQGLPWFDCYHPQAQANRDAGRPCGLMGTPDRVVVYNHPSNLAYQLDYNGGFYAQDSWTVDRLTLDYGMRLDLATLSVPDAPQGPGRFVPAQRQPARPSSKLPRFGPDLSPRLNAAYDLFGDARTVLRLGWNKYVRDVGGNLARRYAYGFAARDGRDWWDCHMTAGGSACSGLDPYGSNHDGIAQNWEIGPRESLTFGSVSAPSRLHDITAREHNRIWTVGVQQEIVPGLSLSGEYRRRTFHDTWWDDNPNWSFAHFGADAAGNPLPELAGVRHFQVARPYPLVGHFTAFSIDPDVRTNTVGFTDRTRGPGYSNVYRGFELSLQGRLPGGGVLFGGWSMEDTGRTSIYGYDTNGGAGSRYGGEVNKCQDIVDRGDEPHQLRFCDAGAYPRPFRNEFKLSGTQPFSLPGVGALQLAASLQAYPGGLGDWGGLQEGIYVSRTSESPRYGTYSEELYGQPGHCVAPCALGQNIVPDGIATVERSTDAAWYPMIPVNSVKFLPFWTQLDLSLQKVLDAGSRRYDVRLELFNALNNGVDLEHGASRNARGSTGAAYQTLSAWERANRVLEGRVIRFAITAAF